MADRHHSDRTTELPRPQPVGVFPLPAGYLLVGAGNGHDQVRAELVAGRIPEQFPVTLRFYELALGGDAEAALSELTGDDPVTMVNRLVLRPTTGLLEELRHRTGGDLLAYVETVAFNAGLTSDPPEPGQAGGEVDALVHTARATVALAGHDRGRAAAELESAARLASPVSAALTGQVLGQLASVQLDLGATKRAQVTFQAAIDSLAGTDLHLSLAELHVAAGASYQEMSDAAPRLLKVAINHYMAALSLISSDSAPETFATANANLGLAYLTMPASDAGELLRVGIAVQSLRHALTVFDPERHPERWSSTQLNLANALVYMPSAHQAINIAEAVRLYEEVLVVRDPRRDPQGRARVLANLGNALAHLGLFDQAKLRLHEARAIFEEFAEDAAVRTVRSVLDHVARQESILRQSRSGEPGSPERPATDSAASR